MRVLLACSWLAAIAVGCSDDSSRAASSPKPDAGQVDDATVAFDAGANQDSGEPQSDAGTPADESPPPAPDGGPNAPPDAGSRAMDAGPDGSGDSGTDAGDASTDEDAGCEAEFDLHFNTPDLTRDRLDPDEVYVHGTLDEGACGASALGHWSLPNLPLVGFECGPANTSSYVRPSDGRMVYVDQDTKSVRAFFCDGCTFAHPQDLYPIWPFMNDPVVPTPACDSAHRPTGIRLSPQGEVLYSCFGDARWYDAAGMPVLDGEVPRHYGSEGKLLLASSVLDVSTGVRADIVGLPTGVVLAARALAQGFWVAVRPTAELEPIELWRVDFDGSTAWVGGYPAPPVVLAPQDYDAVLDAEGRLYQIARQLSPSADLIIRRSIIGASEVLYDESTKPILRLHISRLLTGPGPSVAGPNARVWGGELTEPMCTEVSELWGYAESTPPPPASPLPELGVGSPGAGIFCGDGRCEAELWCCEELNYPDNDAVESWACTATPNDPLNRPSECAFGDSISDCDEAADCIGGPPEDPAVCCLTGGERRSRECTTASICAGAHGNARFTGMLACQSDADCDLAGPKARCVLDEVMALGTPFGQCDAVVQPPNGTRLMASSVLCGDAECPRIDRQICCQGGEDPASFFDPLQMEPPRCINEYECLDPSDRWVARSLCDEPDDCTSPLDETPDDPFECCMVPNVTKPWDRECKRRSTCYVYACREDSDCMRIDPTMHCRVERELTGEGIVRPDVWTCQSP